MFTLNGRTAVVTGGSRGIGYAISKALAEQGMKVAILSKSMSAIERGKKLPGFITFLQIVDELGITPNDLLESVVKTRYSVTTSWLAEVISQLPLEKQNCILELIEFMLTKEKNKTNKK